MYRKTTEEGVNLERDPSSVSMTSSVTMSTSVSASANGAKRSYTSNTLATDVSEVHYYFDFSMIEGEQKKADSQKVS